MGMTTVEWNAWIKFKGGQALWDEVANLVSRPWHAVQPVPRWVAGSTRRSTLRMILRYSRCVSRVLVVTAWPCLVHRLSLCQAVRYTRIWYQALLMQPNGWVNITTTS